MTKRKPKNHKPTGLNSQLGKGLVNREKAREGFQPKTTSSVLSISIRAIDFLANFNHRQI